MKFMQLSDIIGKQRELPDFQRKDKVSCKTRGLFIISKRGFHVSKVVREKHLNIIALLLQATEVTARLIKEGKLSDCLVLFGDCQESAVALGSHIEKLYGMDTKTVKALEQYCECLYQMSVALDEDVQVDVAYEALEQAAKQIEEVYTEEFPDKKEVVFLPYKASMWDSLESIWLSVSKDTSCRTYVVPIPYFDKNSDGSLGEMHYEGELYPEYVLITDWQSYKLEERKPDIVYIHNPYDNYNYVSSVHPRFYAKEIKKYTEKLVYVPYFILKEIEPTNQQDIEGMKHFIWTPGVIYSDEVILQSEKMKQIYINEYEKAAIEAKLIGNHVDRRYLENKFKGTGSPKIEKVLRTKKEELDIPKEWLTLIQKKDGSWKNVILYNTGVSALLRYNEKWIEKLEDSLKVFEENQNKVTLLWRPHPLIETTMKSMRSQMLQRYRKIKSRYIGERWGIYDDSTDLNRAIAVSDVYYGDLSSVLNLCEVAGKKILLQDVYVKNGNDMTRFSSQREEIRISPAAFCVNGNDVWGVHSKYNLFFRYSLESKETQVYSMNPYGDICKKSQFCGIHVHKNKVFLVPCWSKNLLIYDTILEEIFVLDEDENSKNQGRFIKSFIIKQCLYCIPLYEDYILIIDMENAKIVDKIYWRNGNYKENDYINDAFVNEDVIYCVVPNRNDSIMILSDRIIRTIELNKENERYISGEVFRGNIYLYGMNGQVVYEYSELKEKAQRKLIMSTGSGKFSYKDDKYLILDSDDKDELSYLDLEGNIVEIDVTSKSDGEKRNSTLAGLFFCETDRKFYFDKRENILYEVDKDYNKKKHVLLANLKKIDELNSKRLNQDSTINESEIFGLEKMIQSLDL